MPHGVALGANQGLQLRGCDEALHQMIYLGLDHL